MSASSRDNVDIHPSAIVHDRAVLGPGTKVGAFTTIGEHVVTGKNCEIRSHVVIDGHTRLGDEVKVYPFAVLGGEPQHLKYHGEPTRVEIGARVTLRESVTIHRGTEIGGGVTRVGDDTMLMAYTHIAHDCNVGKQVLIANGTQLAGHVTIGDFANIAGLVGIPQFLRVGSYTFIGAGSMLRKDVPPFLVGKGDPFQVQAINAIGLERRGFSEPTVQRLRSLYKILFIRKGLTVVQAMEQVVIEIGEHPEIRMVLDFIRESKHGISR